jgi:hypothetical protein
MPKGDAVLDLRGGRFRLRVIPRSIAIELAVNDDIVVTRLTLPGTHRVTVAWLQIFAADRIAGKVMITLDDNCIVALCNYRVVPGGFHKAVNRKLVVKQTVSLRPVHCHTGAGVARTQTNSLLYDSRFTSPRRH